MVKLVLQALTLLIPVGMLTNTANNFIDSQPTPPSATESFWKRILWEFQDQLVYIVTGLIIALFLGKRY